jgi:chaperonin cofactor prefoldin
VDRQQLINEMLQQNEIIDGIVKRMEEKNKREWKRIKALQKSLQGERISKGNVIEKTTTCI